MARITELAEGHKPADRTSKIRCTRFASASEEPEVYVGMELGTDDLLVSQGDEVELELTCPDGSVLFFSGIFQAVIQLPDTTDCAIELLRGNLDVLTRHPTQVNVGGIVMGSVGTQYRVHLAEGESAIPQLLVYDGRLKIATPEALPLVLSEGTSWEADGTQREITDREISITAGLYTRFDIAQAQRNGVDLEDFQEEAATLEKLHADVLRYPQVAAYRVDLAKTQDRLGAQSRAIFNLEQVNVPPQAIGIKSQEKSAPDAAQGPSDSESSQVEFKATRLSPGLYLLEGVGGFAGGNVAVLTGKDGVMQIDTSFPPHTEKLAEAIAQIADASVDLVVNTHVHGDHAGGNPVFEEQGATIVAHDNVRDRLIRNGVPAAEGQAQAPAGMLPDLTFADAISFHMNGQECYVFHVWNAHTDGDAVVHFRTADVIHAGDVFFNGMFPFIDIDSGGSLDGYITAQERILELVGERTRIIPGHGPLATPSDLEASVKMLKEARKAIGALIAKGKSIDEILAAKPLAAYEAQSWQFITTERMIRQMHRDLSGN